MATKVSISMASDDNELLQFLYQAAAVPLSDDDTAELAMLLANSGKRLLFDNEKTADIASTGGPTSLSTLLCPIFLSYYGWLVPKLGIVGRPAGAIDIMAQLPSYRFNLDAHSIHNILYQCGYAHFVSNGQFTPLDARLFVLRKQHNLLNVPQLAAASILSKKIAVDVKTVGVDIRVAPYGNFGSTYSEAHDNAELLIRIGDILHVKIKCFLTDASLPYQPYIGRGEALLALWKIISGAEISCSLRHHLSLCHKMAAVLIGVIPGPLDLNRFKYILQSHLEHQGSSLNELSDVASSIELAHNIFIRSPRSGYISSDLQLIRAILVDEQNKINGDNLYPDPCGVILHADCGCPIRCDSLLASVRINSEFVSTVIKRLSSAISVTQEYRVAQEFNEVP